MPGLVVVLSFVVVMPSFGLMSVGLGLCGFGFVVVVGLAGCCVVVGGFGRVVGAGATVVGLGLVVAAAEGSDRVLVVVERGLVVVVGDRDDELGGAAGGITGGAASFSGVSGLSTTPLADLVKPGLKPAGQLTTAGATWFRVTVRAV